MSNIRPKRSKERHTGSDASSDSRLARIQSDPLFRLPAKKQHRVTVDSRFEHMLHDDDFHSTAKVDRYGRNLLRTRTSKNLERLYKVEKPALKRKEQAPVSEEEDEEEDEEEEACGLVKETVSDEEEDDEEEEEGGVSVALDEDVEREPKLVGHKYDPARNGGYAESSSSEEDTEDESELEDDEESGLAARQAEDIPEGEITSRLAVVNLDWDNLRAVDLMAVLRSFAPREESIKRVTIYPSEFGQERLEREEVEGPPKELFQRKPSERRDDDFEAFSDEDNVDEDEDEDEDERIRQSLVQEDLGEDFDPVQLRQYQLERLRYYYAVVDCSSDMCAHEIYQNVDGTEYLSTSNFFDLRFIPQDTDFSDDKPRDFCTSVPDNYAPNEFSTAALQHSNVKLTWDADDANRKETQKRAFSRAEIDENDLKAYLASDGSDEEDIEATELETVAEETQERQDIDAAPKLGKKEAERQKMRALLGLSAQPIKRSKDEPVGDMQITFSSALGAGNGSVFANEPITDETTVEKYVRKERERKLRRKEKSKAGKRGETADDEADDPAEPEPDANLGFDDPFFTEPANDQKAAKAARKEEKRKKRAEREAEESHNAAQRASLERLMADGQEDSAAGVQHFDIDELKKAEKAAKRKGKKGKLRASEKAALEAKAKDTFEMNVDDPRFQGVFEDPALALDPNSARFNKTTGMQKLLDAGRKKRARDMEHDEEAVVGKKKKSSANAHTNDLDRLVQRVKGRSR